MMTHEEKCKKVLSKYLHFVKYFGIMVARS